MYVLKSNVGENAEIDSRARNGSGVKVIITKKIASSRRNINDLMNTSICNIQFEVSFKSLEVINLSENDRYFIVHS